MAAANTSLQKLQPRPRCGGHGLHKEGHGFARKRPWIPKRLFELGLMGKGAGLRNEPRHQRIKVVGRGGINIAMILCRKKGKKIRGRESMLDSEGCISVA